MKNRVVSAALGLALAGGSLLAFSAPTAQAAEIKAYDNCEAAFDAYVTLPLLEKEQPKMYAVNKAKLDKNGDGVACESWKTKDGAPTSTATTKITWPDRAPKGALYPNCDAVRAAGKDPLPKGATGYGKWLDRDNDGFGCDKDDPAWKEAPSGKWTAPETKPSTKPGTPAKVVDKGRGVSAETGVEDADPTLALGLVAAAAVAGGVALRRKH